MPLSGYISIITHRTVCGRWQFEHLPPLCFHKDGIMSKVKEKVTRIAENL